MSLQKLKKPSCSFFFWHPPVCQDYKSENGCTIGRKCFFRHIEAEEKPSKKSKEGGAKGLDALLKDSTILIRERWSRRLVILNGCG